MSSPESNLRWRLGLGLFVVLAAVGAVVWLARGRSRADPGPVTVASEGGGRSTPAGVSRDALTPELRAAKYVGRAVCGECHPKEIKEWEGSHHHLAMQPVGPKVVRAPFAGESVSTPDGACRFRKDGDRHLADWTSPGGATTTHELTWTFGWNPLQQFLVEASAGRKQTFPFGWDVNGKRWIWVPTDENLEPADPVHWMNRGANWNFMCADCHSTGFEKRFDPEKGTYASHHAEVEVSCEACHGPGSHHVDLARAAPERRLPRDGIGLVRLRESPALPPGRAGLERRDRDIGRTQLDTCAPCHARREQVQPGFRPGANFHDHYHPETLDSHAYFPDGQIREENYEYGSFHLSLMHARGVRCTDCHQPHTGKLRAEGNKLCANCHEPTKYDGPAHTGHRLGTRGANCVDCHMPETTYMKVDPRRDHGFHIPRPDRTISLGIPNACHRCHQDKSAEWAETELRKLHGPEKPRPQRLEFARTIALGRQGDPKAKDGLLRLINDAEVPPLVRGAAVTLVASLPESNASPPLTNWLQDPEPMVRVRAARSLADRIGAPGFGAAEQARLANLDPAAVKAMAERLKDPVAPVRMEAARALAGVPVDRLPPDAPAALEEGIRAYEAAQRELADDPAGCINLAALAVARGRPDEARVWLERALQRDAAAHLARMNLAWLDLESGRRAEALARFEEVAARLERDLVAEQARKDTGEKALILRRLGEGAASAHDAVGLLLAESAGPTETPDSARARLSKAAERLELAVRRDPSRHRTWYNLGLARLQLEQTAAAANCFRKACELEPNGADYLLQLALIHVRANEPDKAKRLLDHLLTRHPEHLEARQWRLRLERTP